MVIKESKIRATYGMGQLLAVLVFTVIAFVGIVAECIVSANWLAFFVLFEQGCCPYSDLSLVLEFEEEK